MPMALHFLINILYTNKMELNRHLNFIYDTLTIFIVSFLYCVAKMLIDITLLSSYYIA